MGDVASVLEGCVGEEVDMGALKSWRRAARKILRGQIAADMMWRPALWGGRRNIPGNGKALSAARRIILARGADFKCVWCETPLTRETFSLDHVIPASWGGKNGIENLVLACRRCNWARGSSGSTDKEEIARMRMRMDEAEARREQRKKVALGRGRR